MTPWVFYWPYVESDFNDELVAVAHVYRSILYWGDSRQGLN